MLYSGTWLFIHSIYNTLHLTPTSSSIPPPTPAPLATTSLSSMSASLLLFCRQVRLCCISDSTHKWCHVVFVFLFVTSPSMIISSCIRVTINDMISFLFKGWVAFHCICAPHLLYLFLCWWTLRLLPSLGYCKQCCYEHAVHGSFWILVLSWYMPRNGIAGSYGKAMFSFLRQLHSLFLSGKTFHLHSLQQYQRVSFYPHAL